MSASPTDWDGPDGLPEVQAGAAPTPPPPPTPDPPTMKVGPTPNPIAESPEFTLGAALEPSDDSPTIISRAQRRQAHTGENITTSLRGRCLAHFELHEPIGVGGMAAVIRAHDKQLDRLVALKILPPAMSGDGESLRRFQQEARAAARLDHENIARVFYCGTDQGLHFIAFEFVEGDNLRVILERRGRLPVSETIRYMLQVATGLAHASSRGVVHRDIKPSNIIITPTGRAKLVDMGLARNILSTHGDGALTQSGVTLGTFDYISPEQALEPRDADVRSDIYSLGCTFYHMLTGQPPVPEGTAAKKLHHHQHVAPVDPRQLNPAIPDEVAAVLARMMAKDPKDRYQRCEHLVQHLMHLAQKMGASADMPEGVLFVDAPLPSPPSSRPLLVGGIAAAVLIGLIVLLGSLPTTPGTTDFPFVEVKPTDKAPATSKEEKPPRTEKGKTVQPPEVPPRTTPAVRKTVVAQDGRDLAEAFKHAVVDVKLPGKSFDLRGKRDESDEPGLVFKGKELVVQAQDDTKRPTLRLDYDASGKDAPWNALTIAAGQATFRNVRFEIDAAGTSTPMAAVLRSGGRVRFENCEFVQVGLPLERDKAQLRSVLLAGVANEANDGQPDVVFDRCYFRGGHEAVVFTTSANVQMKDCAFASYKSLFHFRGSKVEDAELRLQHCSAMLEDRSSVFVLSEDAFARLFVNHCLFSNPAPNSDPDSGAVLIRQVNDGISAYRYSSEFRNVYHNLSAFLVLGARTRASDLEEFRRNVGSDARDRSVTVTVNPWQSEKPSAAQPRDAFQANQDVAELRQIDHPRTRMIGVESCVWGNLYPATLRALKEKIVDITVKESAHGVYPSLAQAIGEAKPGDTIKIKVNGKLYVSPLRLEDRSDLDLTIKPEEGFRPILALGQTMDPDAALFRLGDGKLNVENIEFELPSPPVGLKAQSLVFLTGDAQCAFKNCLFTMKESKDGRVSRSLFTLPDPGTVMRSNKGPSQGPPRIILKSCFARGDGDLVSVRGSQAFGLDLDDVLLALDGSLLIVDGSPKDTPTKPPVQININRVTAYLTEPLLQLRISDTKPGLVPTHMVGIWNSVFATTRERKALVHLEGMESDDHMKRLFSWGEGKHNVYSGFQSMLEQRAKSDTTMLSQFDRAKWDDFAPRELGRRIEKVTFSGWPVEQPLSTALASFFRVKGPDFLGYGADVERLPGPAAAEGEKEPANPPAEAAARDEN